MDQPDKIFFAVKAAEAGRRRACEAARATLPVSVPANFQRERVIHATIVLAGLSDDSRVTPTALEMAALVRAARFTLVFDTLVGFGGPKGVLALTCSTEPPEWAILRTQLSQIPRRLKTAIVGGTTPHLTLAYGCPPTVPIPLAEPVAWSADEFLLIRSLHGKAEHEELGCWALR
ncbi:hypothetical protein BH10PSE2_BH10PSE2_22930 [soil metagenome]